MTKAINLCESYTPQNQQLLMGLKSNLLSTQLRRKQGLRPNEPMKIVIDTDKDRKSVQSDSSENATQPESEKESLIKRILRILFE